MKQLHEQKVLMPQHFFFDCPGTMDCLHSRRATWLNWFLNMTASSSSARSIDSLREKLNSFDWPLPDEDDESYQEIKRRIAETGKRRRLLTYSQLVKGIEFRLSSMHDGAPFMLNIGGWTGQDRYIIGQFLGKLSCESYAQHGFMANALVVDAQQGRPSKNFFQWMEHVEAISDSDETAVLRFWAEQLQKAQQFYRRQK